MFMRARAITLIDAAFMPIQAATSFTQSHYHAHFDASLATRAATRQPCWRYFDAADVYVLRALDMPPPDAADVRYCHGIRAPF